MGSQSKKMKHIAFLISTATAFKIPEQEAKALLKFSKPFSQAQTGGYLVDKSDNWWESNFRRSSQERECAEEYCYLEEYIESKENEIDSVDIRKMVDSKSEWYDNRVEAYFNYYYTYCLPFANDRGEVKLCLEAADEALEEVFSDPRMPGEETKPIQRGFINLLPKIGGMGVTR